MNSTTLTLDLDSDSLFQALVQRFSFAESTREWSRCRQTLTAWEDEHLLVENPPPEKLERHRKVVERLIFLDNFSCSLPLIRISTISRLRR